MYMTAGSVPACNRLCSQVKDYDLLASSNHIRDVIGVVFPSQHWGGSHIPGTP